MKPTGDPNRPRIQFKEHSSGKVELFINGHRITDAWRRVAIFRSLWSNAGRVVAYARLCSDIGQNGTSERQLHVLRQYVRWVNGVLMVHNLPYVIATTSGVGNALCEVARTNRPH
jgi:hypothetical protein